MAEELEVGVLLSATDEVSPALAQAAKSAQNFVQEMNKSSKALVTLGSMVGAAGFAMYKFGKQSFSAAARVSELKVSIDAIGEATGIGAKAINEAASNIAKQGIEMAAAQGIAIEYAQANLNMADAAKVARVAQDLAVISQRNSTDTAQLLTRAVRTGNSQLLKSAGISRMASEGYAMYAKEIGKTATTLTAAERQQAMINLILDEGKRVAGVYEASMTEAGKVLRSFPRLMNDMQVAVGTALLQGLGPLIKSSYDLTNAFSKTVKEGGALNPILTELGVAMKLVFQPISDGLKKLADFFTMLNRSKVAVDGLGQKLATAMPIIAALSTGLSALAGKQLLNALLPATKAITGFLNPLQIGIAVLVALTPRLRNALLQMVGAALQLVGPLARISEVLTNSIAGALDTVAPLLEGLAALMVGAFAIVGPVLKVIADLLVFLQKPIEFLIILWGVKWVASQLIAAKAALMTQMQLAALGTQTTVTGRAATFAVKSYTNFAFGLQTTGSVAKAFGGTMVAVGNTIKATMVSVMTTILPMLAITAALWAGMAIFNKIREADKAREAAVKGVTDALKQQIDALKTTNEALAEYLGNVENLQNALVNDSEASQEFIRVMHLQGVATKDALTELIAYKQDRVAYTAAQYKGITATYAEADALARYTLAAQGGVEMTAEAAAIFPRLTQEQFAVANAYRDTTAAMNAMDLAEALKKEREMLEIKSKDAALAYAAADAYIARAEARGVELSDLDREIETRRYAQIQLTKYAKVQEEVGNKTRATAVTTKSMIQRLKEITAAAADGKVKMEEMYDGMFGMNSIDLYKAQKQIYEVRTAVSTLSNKVKDSEGNFDSFKGAALDLANQVATNAAEMRNLEMSNEDIAGATNVLIGTFVEAGKKAGFTQEQINGVLESLGMLNGYRSVAMIEADISKFKAQLQVVLDALEAVGGGDPEMVRAAARLRQILNTLDAEAKAAAEAAEKFKGLNDATKKGSSATKEFTGRQKELRDQIVQTVQDAIEKETDKLQELRSKMEALKSALRSTIVESASLGNAFEFAKRKADEFNQKIDEAEQAQREYAQQVANSIRQTLSLSDAFGESQQSSQAVEAAWMNATEVANEYAAVQQELVENVAQQAALEKMLYGDGSRYARADVVKALTKTREDAIKIVERLVEAEENLGVAMDWVNQASAQQISFLDALRKRVADAKDFASVIGQLSSMGLNKDALDQIVSAGAVAGTQMAKELLSGGQTAISETNTLFTELADVAQQTGVSLGDTFYKVGSRVGLDFGSALMERAKMATDFAKKVEMLAAQGLSPENITMLLNAGLEAGTAMADELIKGGQAAIDNANQIHQSLTKLAEDLGVKLSGQFFDAGIAMGERIVAGLKEKLKEVEKALQRAKTISQLENLLEATRTKVGASTGAATVQAGPSMGQGMGIGTGWDWDKIPLVPFANGGIVKTPTLGIVGEAGPEAVIPLSQMGGMGNTYNITVNAGMGADGGQIGDDIVEALRKYERRNGTVPIKTL